MNVVHGDPGGIIIKSNTNNDKYYIMYWFQYALTSDKVTSYIAYHYSIYMY